MSAVVGPAEPGIVAIEWPVADIAPEYLRIEAHAVLVTAARNEAVRLGLAVGDGSCLVRRLHDPERIRFTWSAFMWSDR